MSGRDGMMTVIKFVGWLMMAAGGLIAVTAGACTVFVGLPMMLSSLDYPLGVWGNLMMVAIVGGIPILVGTGLFIGGRVLARKGEIRQRPPRRVEETREPD